MSEKIHYNHCPVCSNTAFTEVLICKDYTVSQQSFTIAACKNCGLRFTQDIPGPDEVGAYYQAENYISHTDTSKGLVSKLYKLARRFTLRQKLKLVQEVCAATKGNLLDVGSGTGAFLHTMQQAGWDIAGLEPDKGARKLASELYGIAVQEPDALYTLPSGQFHAITLWHVLEHIHDLHAYLQQFRQLLKPGGKLLIAVPNYTSADAAHYQQYWAAYDVPRHLYHFSPAALRHLASLHDFEVVATRAMWLDAVYIAMLSEKYREGRLQFFAAMWQGLSCTLKTIGNREKASSLIYVLQQKT
jgi:2-polyprenyl-3-methyl-5-hydroxy-6-metoxy-1,4-benzoquinol methylase